LIPLSFPLYLLLSSLLPAPFSFPYPNLIYLESNDGNTEMPNATILIMLVRLCYYIMVIDMILVVAVIRKERGRERAREGGRKG
jgi:hypothetical protein